MNIIPAARPVEWVGFLSYTHKQTKEEQVKDLTDWHRHNWNPGAIYGADMKPFEYKPAQWDLTFSDNVEIGLRSDGVVVWRKTP